MKTNLWCKTIMTSISNKRQAGGAVISFNTLEHLHSKSKPTNFITSNYNSKPSPFNSAEDDWSKFFGFCSSHLKELGSQQRRS